jgi:hypothetical protein
MQSNKTITATEAVYWIAFWREKTSVEIAREIEEHNSKLFLRDRFVRYYLRHKTKGMPWPPKFLSREWQKIKKLTTAQNIPKMLAVYKKSIGADWETMRRLCNETIRFDRRLQFAEHELLAAARQGTIIFYGKRYNRDSKNFGEITEIPRAVFMAYNWSIKTHNNELQHNPKSPKMIEALWGYLHVERHKVKSLLRTPAAQSATRKSPASQADIVQFLVKFAEQQPDSYLPGRTSYCRVAAKHFAEKGKTASDGAIRAAVKTIKNDPKKYGAIVRSRGRRRRGH